MKTSKLQWSYIFLVYVFLYLPLIILIIFSFNEAPTGAVWKGFSLKWYDKLFHSSTLITGLINSLLIGISSATLVTIIGTLSAVTLFRFKFFGKNFIISLLYILIMSPEIIMGISSIFPAVVAAWILSFTISMDDSICAFFTSGPRFEILPQKIYAMVRTGVKPEVNALSTIIFGVSMLIVIVTQIMLKERKR